MKRNYKILGILVALSVFLCGVITSCCFVPEKSDTLDKSKLTLVWEDNFNGSELDTEKWNRVIWSSGEVNNELQAYVDNKDFIIDDPAASDKKALRIYAVGGGNNWQSGRIDTSGNFNFKYGYAEARIRLPIAYDENGNVVKNTGAWPAFWMMPENVQDTEGGVYGIWPRSGEIDILEYSPSTSGNKVYATLHHSTSQAAPAVDSYSTLGSTTMYADGKYHTFGMMWTEGILEAFYDGKSLGVVYANSGNGDWAKWPYDQPYYLILNLAMGGNLGGAVNEEIRTVNYDIDYVKVYKIK